MEIQFLFVVEVPEPPVGNRELELEGRFGWKFSSCSWSRFLNCWSGTRNWNWRADLDGISVPVHGRSSLAAGLEPGTGTGGQSWMEFQFLFVVEVPEPTVGNRELELEGRFG